MKATRIPYIRAISDDTRPTRIAIEAVLANTSLSRLIRQVVCDAFADAGLLCGGQVKAAASVDDDGRYLVTAVDGALSKCRMPLSVIERVEIKNTLARYSLLK